MYVDQRIKDTYRVPQPEGRGAYLRLDQNENPDGVPKWLFDEVMSKISPEFLSIYPEETKLTQKYAKLIGFDESNVTLCDGSVVGMWYVIKVFGEPGKKLICVTPTFGMYKVYAEMNGMQVTQLRYNEDHSFSVSSIINSIDDDTGMVVLVNPNMPIGNSYTQAEIKSVIEIARNHNAYVMIDEAYYYFCKESSIDLVSKYDNVFVLRTFSKMLSIPSLRLGCIISNPDNIHCINNFKPHYTVNSIALLFGEAIVDNHDRLIEELSRNFEKGREKIIALLDENNYSYLPSDGCFICVKPKNKTSEYITQELKNRGILILCGTGDLTGYLRISVCNEKYMDRFMSTLLSIDAVE